MRRVRIGNDIYINMHVMHNGKPADFTGKKLTLMLVCGYSKIGVDNFSISANKISFVFKGVDQKSLGKYYITLYENFGKDNQNVCDTIDLFLLEPRTSKNYNVCGRCDVISLDVDINVDFCSQDYNNLANLPFINGVEVKGRKTLHQYGIQPEGDYVNGGIFENKIKELESKIESINPNLDITVESEILIIK